LNWFYFNYSNKAQKTLIECDYLRQCTAKRVNGANAYCDYDYYSTEDFCSGQLNLNEQYENRLEEWNDHRIISGGVVEL